MSKSSDRLTHIDGELERLKQKKQALLKEHRYIEKNETQKKRANRLIQTGALAEKYFKLDNLNMDEREELFKMFESFVNANKPNRFKK